MKRSLAIRPSGKLRYYLLAVVVVALMAWVTHLLVSEQRPIQAQAQGSGSSAGICDRTEFVRNAILLKLPDVDDCADVTDAHLAGIAELVMLDLGTITVEDGDFAGLSALRVLYLHHNDLSSLPENALDGLTSLEELYLYNNTLTTLPADTFDDLDNLEKLDLSYNSLSSLPADVFDGLSKLEELNLRNNELANFPDGIFDGLSRLKVLNLNSNQLDALADGTFAGLVGLRTLNLGGNPGSLFTFTAALEQGGDSGVLVRVAEGAPFDMTVTLGVSEGTLATTTATVAGGSSTSTVVAVTWNASSTGATVSVESATFDGGATTEGIRPGLGDSLIVGPGICGRTQEVRDAILSALPDITDCADVTYQHLAGITGEMDLQFAAIPALESGDFWGLKGLEVLYLGGNDFTTLPDDVFDGLIGLQALVLFYSKVAALPDGVFDDLDSLRELYLGFSSLGSIQSDAFDGLPGLTDLNLSETSLTTLPDDVFDADLEELWLQLSEIPSTGGGRWRSSAWTLRRTARRRVWESRKPRGAERFNHTA